MFGINATEGQSKRVENGLGHPALRNMIKNRVFDSPSVGCKDQDGKLVPLGEADQSSPHAEEPRVLDKEGRAGTAQS